MIGSSERSSALDQTWRNRFVVEDAHDLAFEIATVLHRAGQLSSAAGYYRRSVELRGPHPTTFFNLALCLLDLGQLPPAKAALEVVCERTLVGGAIVFDHFTGVDRFKYTLGERMAGEELLNDTRYFHLHGTGVFYRQN